MFCNPTCKDTAFGPLLKLPKTLRRTPLYARGEAWRRTFEKKRRAQFGTRKNILNNGFYKHIPKKTIAAARLRGEISGCYEK